LRDRPRNLGSSQQPKNPDFVDDLQLSTAYCMAPEAGEGARLLASPRDAARSST
jgi:hypothetical protein